MAPFSHARLSATLWNSLELYVLCCNDPWGLNARQGLLLYWVVGTLAHLLAVLSFQIIQPSEHLPALGHGSCQDKSTDSLCHCQR